MPTMDDWVANTGGVAGSAPNIHQNSRFTFNISQLDSYHGTAGHKDNQPSATQGSVLGRGAFNVQLPGQNTTLGESFLNKTYGVTPGSGKSNSIEMQWGAATLKGKTAYNTSDTVYNFNLSNNPLAEDANRQRLQAFGYAQGTGASKVVFSNFDRGALVSSLKNIPGYNSDVLRSGKKLSAWVSSDPSVSESVSQAYSNAYRGNTTYDFSNQQEYNSTKQAFNSQINSMMGIGPVSGNASGIPKPTLAGVLGITPGVGNLNPALLSGQLRPKPNSPMDLRLSGIVEGSGQAMSIQDKSDISRTAAHEIAHGTLAEALRPDSFGAIQFGVKGANGVAMTRPGNATNAAAISLAGPAMDMLLKGDVRSDTHRGDILNWAVSTGQAKGPEDITPELVDKFYKEAGNISQLFKGQEANVKKVAEMIKGKGWQRDPASFMMGQIATSVRENIKDRIPAGAGAGQPPSGVPPTPPTPPGEPPEPPSSSEGEPAPKPARKSRASAPDIEGFSEALKGLNATLKTSIKQTNALTEAHSEFIKQTGGVGGASGGGGGRKGGAPTPEYDPDFRDRLRPYLMGGAAGRNARKEAQEKGWYGEEGSAENAAWKVGGSVLGTANRALLGYRTIRHFGQELIDPLANAALAYQAQQQSQNTGLMRTGAVGLGQLTTENQQLLNFQNARDKQQLGVGAAFQRAWLPSMTALASTSSGGLGELASILGPSLAVGVGLSFIGQPELGIAAGIGTAAVGAAGTMQSTVNDPKRMAQLTRGLQTKGLSAFADSPLGYAGLTFDYYRNGPGKIAQGVLMETNYQNQLRGTAYTAGFSADQRAYAMDRYLEDNQFAVNNLSVQGQQSAFMSAQKIMGSPSKMIGAQFNQVMQSVGNSALAGYDYSNAIAGMAPLQGGYSYLAPMMVANNGNAALGSNMIQRSLMSVPFTQMMEQAYGTKNAGAISGKLYGAASNSDLYSSPESVDQAAKYMFNYGMQNYGDVSARRQGISRVFAAGLNPDQLTNLYAANQGVDTLNIKSMAGVADFASTKMQSMLDQGMSPAEIQMQAQRQSYTAGLNQMAGQYGMGLINTQPFQDFTSQQAGFMQSVLSGDTTANSLFADQVPGNEWRRTVQTGSRGGTAGMHAYYDEAITPEVRDEVAATGKQRGYMRGDGRFSVNALAGMNQVQREQASYAEEIRTREYDFGLAQKQLGRSIASTTGVGLGKYLPGFEGKGEYYFEDQGVALHRTEQDYSYQMQGRQLDLQRQQMQYNFGYQEQQMNIQRSHQVSEQQWGMQDIAYQRNVNAVQYGFSMVDADENIRYARGRERRTAMRHRDEATVMHSMQTGQMDKEEDRAKQRIKWSEEQFGLDKQHFQQEKQFAEQNFNLTTENYRKQRDFITQERQLEDQKRAFTRALHAQEMQEAQQSLNFHQLEKRTMDDLNGTTKVFTDKLTTMNAQVGFIPTQIQNANTALESFNSHLAMVTQAAGSATMSYYPGNNYQGVPINNNLTSPIIPPPPIEFAEGGYTGTGAKHTPAGVVHKGEFVVPQGGTLVAQNTELTSMVKQMVDLLKQILQEGGNAMIMVNDRNVGQLSRKARSLVDEAYVQ